MPLPGCQYPRRRHQDPHLHHLHSVLVFEAGGQPVTSNLSFANAHAKSEWARRVRSDLVIINGSNLKEVGRRRNHLGSYPKLIVASNPFWVRVRSNLPDSKDSFSILRAK